MSKRRASGRSDTSKDYMPTRAEIWRLTRQFRAGWSEEETRSRAGWVDPGEYTIPVGVVLPDGADDREPE